jgi:hypothetical protein
MSYSPIWSSGKARRGITSFYCNLNPNISPDTYTPSWRVLDHSIERRMSETKLSSVRRAGFFGWLPNDSASASYNSGPLAYRGPAWCTARSSVLYKHARPHLQVCPQLVIRPKEDGLEITCALSLARSQGISRRNATPVTWLRCQEFAGKPQSLSILALRHPVLLLLNTSIQCVDFVAQT